MEMLAQQIVNGLSAGMAYALVALGLTLIFGILHVINFAHGEFFMLGGLVAVLAAKWLGLPYIAALPLAAALVGAVAWGVDRVAVRSLVQRRDGLSDVLLSTYAFSLLLFHGTLGAWGPAPARVEGFEGSFDLGPVTLTYQRLFILLFGAALIAGLLLVLKKTAFGRHMRAVAQSRYAAQVVGIDVAKVGTQAYILAAGLAAVAGAMLAPVILFSPLMGGHTIIKAFVVVVLGGMGSVVGAVICGLGLGVLEALMALQLPEGIATAVIYVLLIAMLLVRPQGLFGKAP
jgi:branched-chain amino acid transport system permease protein